MLCMRKLTDLQINCVAQIDGNQSSSIDAMLRSQSEVRKLDVRERMIRLLLLNGTDDSYREQNGIIE